MKQINNTGVMCQQYTQTLAMVTQWYNRLQTTILPVELGLVRDEMDRTRQQLSPALQELTWAQDDLWDYIQTTRDLVKVLTGPDTRPHTRHPHAFARPSGAFPSDLLAACHGEDLGFMRDGHFVKMLTFPLNSQRNTQV